MFTLIYADLAFFHDAAMQICMTTVVERPVLGFEDAIAVKSAQSWLALGILDEAKRELGKLKNGAALHPEARKVFRQLQRALTGSLN